MTPIQVKINCLNRMSLGDEVQLSFAEGWHQIRGKRTYGAPDKHGRTADWIIGSDQKSEACTKETSKYYWPYDWSFLATQGFRPKFFRGIEWYDVKAIRKVGFT